MSRRWPAYSAGRLGAVIARPLCLYVANNRLGPDAAQALAVAFLASSVGMVASAADPHRHYYVSRYSQQPVNGMPLYVYLAAVLQCGAIGSAIAFGVCLRFTGSLPVAVLAALLYVTEKLGDEVQRLRLFERDFDRWGRTNLLRSALQVGVVGLAALAGIHQPATVLAGLAVAAAIAFAPQVPRTIWQRVPDAAVARRLARRGAAHLWRGRHLWLLLALGAGVGYLDRGFSVLLDRATLPLFMLVVMAFSVVQMAVDFYYVSRHRRDFLEQRIRIADALQSAGFLACLGGGLAVGSLATVAILATSRNGAEFSPAYIAFIAALQALIATTAVPQQILYWHHLERAMLRIELSFWIGLAVGAGVLAAGGVAPSAGLWLIIAAVSLRLGWFAWSADRIPKQERQDSA